MKRAFLAMAISAALLVAATSGNALAKDRSPNGADMNSALNDEWANQLAMETGNLPGAPGGASAGDRMTAAGPEVPTVEIGGVRVRLGIDTGP